MSKRIVVTGMGVVSPIGNTVNEFWNSLIAGKCGIDHLTSIDIEDFPVKVAAEVKDFDTSKYFNKKEARRMDKFCQFAVASAIDAWRDAGLDNYEIDSDRAGVIYGSGIGGITTIEKETKRLINFGPRKVSPFFIPMSIINMAAGHISIALKIKGFNAAVQTACATGTTAIGEALCKLKLGMADVIVAGGSESSITPLGLSGFSVMKALYDGNDPLRASIPFDAERSGFVMGEGAGSLVLETLEHARKRGAKIYAEVVGYGCTADSYHITAPSPEAEGASKAISLAIDMAGIDPCDIDYINAHGTSTPLNDKLETKAIKKSLGEASSKVAISSTKSMTGHLLGAAGAVEAIACVKALQESIIPPTINNKEKDPECDLDYVINQARKQEINYALSNSLGFGGHNVCLVFKRWDD